MSEQLPGVYRHYKGGLYYALPVARHTETNEELIAYVPLEASGTPELVVRPYSMFFGSIEMQSERQPRFEYIGSRISEEEAKRLGKFLLDIDAEIGND